MAKVQHEIPERLKSELASSTKSPYFTSVKHSVNLGDLIAVMGALRRYYEVTKRQIKVLQTINLQGAYYPGAVHPTVDENGVAVCMNIKMFEMVKPLIESQQYIHSLEKYEGQKVDLDFDVIRQKTFVNLPHGAIQNWIPLAFPDLQFDLSKPWIELSGECPKHIKKQMKGKIMLNFTERYRNGMIDYFFLKNYIPDLIFAGTEKEHWLFCNKWQLTIPRLEVNDFLELAYAIKEAKFLLCNQSMIWNLSYALGTPKILELCQFAQNCIHGIGQDNYGFFHQIGAEYYMKTLYNKTFRK